ncbi:hypothetical protein [Pelagibacterium halotolerans]|uniref:Transmembrane protein n=1 Tax=Pelagibacterium halotolerans (strain DSM 22347 / JCM 15775 / CGMCC 1.7692 / B2) TaxID=1082931 RepID=G4RDE3_PELHB|nr:hypothetical protein [Pelagibacterium halotolerans]AEQ50769.1 hypothetical protein KKY_730 [Pelagibacterium halotolerans B2]QJR19313.1 hypothetical protein HKM20_13210 [Pelagibacterium halotolerans]SDZ95354.1 hypothetical protein SAMN05428936_101656 [Pelagibacterium halotolerans]
MSDILTVITLVYLLNGLLFALADARYRFGFVTPVELVAIVLFWPVLAVIFLALAWMEVRAARRQLRAGFFKRTEK